MPRSADNGLDLKQHALVLLISVVLSGIAHFWLLYFFAGVSVANPAQALKQERAQTALPPVQIEALARIVQEVKDFSQEDEPDVSGEIRKVEQALQEHSGTAHLPAPLPVLPEPLPPGAQEKKTLATQEKTLGAQISGQLMRQAVAHVPDTLLTRKNNPEPRWVLDAQTPRAPEASDLTFALGAFEPILALPALAVSPEPKLPGRVLEAPIVEGAPLREAQAREAESVAQDLRDATEGSVALSAEKSEGAHYQPIDERLQLELSVFETERDPANRYFRLDILRRPESTLPIMPKDVVFIQDVSGSIGSNRLDRAKEALKAALFNTLRAGDRFTIFAFRNVTLTPSASWLTFNPETRTQAETFIQSLRARGSTDLFLLLQDLLTLPIDPERPLLVVVVTDGEPTVGVTETTRIIGEFSRMNKGRLAVYAFGTEKRNAYFLDMLCYINRGENVSASGRTSRIAKELTPVFEAIRNPVMKDLALTFDGASKGDVHPKNLTPLYADRPLTVYGRVPKQTRALTCQLRGRSAEEPYDAVFTFSFANAKRSDVDLRQAWAERAMFDLLAEFAENPSASLRAKIDAFSAQYAVPNPYKR